MYVSPTHEFKESVFVVHTFSKDVKKFCILKFFALSIAIKNRRNFVNRINENSKYMGKVH